MTDKGLTDERRDRLKGAILGAACANALGGSCIGLNHKEILATTGISVLRDFVPGLTRSKLPEHQPGQVLEDYRMALAMGKALVDCKGKLESDALKKQFQKLLEDRDFLESGAGAMCLAAIRRLVDGLPPSEDPMEAGHVSGAARAFVLGCLPNGGTPRKDVAIDQAALTHKSKAVAAASVVLADTIAGFIEGVNLESESDVRTYVGKQLELARSIDGRFADFWDDVAPDLDYSSPASDVPYSLANVESSVTECVPTSVGIFLIFRHDLEEAICAAARAGGDTDTAAMIVGALSGAYHGASKIPSRWLEKVSNRDETEEVIDGLIKLWEE